jgi:hypothetical protein
MHQFCLGRKHHRLRLHRRVDNDLGKVAGLGRIANLPFAELKTKESQRIREINYCKKTMGKIIKACKYQYLNSQKYQA